LDIDFELELIQYVISRVFRYNNQSKYIEDTWWVLCVRATLSRCWAANELRIVWLPYLELHRFYVRI